MKMFNALIRCQDGHFFNILVLISRKKAPDYTRSKWRYSIKADYAADFIDPENKTFFICSDDEYQDVIEFFLLDSNKKLYEASIESFTEIKL